MRGTHRFLSSVTLILALMVPASAAAQQWPGIVDPTRAVNWSNAGAAGGIFGVGIEGSYTSPSRGSGYTIPTIGTSNRLALEHQIVSATQSGVSAVLTWNASEDWECILAGLKTFGAAACTCSNSMTLTGAGCK